MPSEFELLYGSYRVYGYLCQRLKDNSAAFLLVAHRTIERESAIELAGFSENVLCFRTLQQTSPVSKSWYAV